MPELRVPKFGQKWAKTVSYSTQILAKFCVFGAAGDFGPEL